MELRESPSGHRKSKLPVNFKAKFNIKIQNIRFKDISKKLDVSYDINFADTWNFSSTVIKGDQNPTWTDRHAFDYSPDDLIHFHNKHLTIDLWKRAVGGKKALIGYVKVDLFTLATGTVSHNLALMKKSKKDEVEKPVKSTRIQFELTMTCTTEAEISVYDIAVVLLRQSSLKVQDPSRKNDCFLEFFLKSDAKKLSRTTICYNTMTPSWIDLPPIKVTGTLKEILSDFIIIRAFDYNTTVVELLGECQIPIMRVYSLSETRMPFKETFIFQNVPFGEISGDISFAKLPPFAQMEGGHHTEDGIFDGAPVVEDAPQPSKVFLKLELLDAIYPRAKSMQRLLMESNPVPVEFMRLQDTIKTIVKRVPHSPTPHTVVQELIDIVEKEPDVCAKIFRVDSLLSYFLPLLNYPNMEFSQNVAKLLSLVSKDNTKNLETIYRNNGLSCLLKAMGTRDERLMKYVLDLLIPLSIRDSNIQQMFQKEGIISFMVSMLAESKSTTLLRRIVPVLTNLCYGLAGGSPSNKDVIRLAGGVPLLSQCLLYKNDQLIKNIFQCFSVLGKDNIENQKAIIKELRQVLNSAYSKENIDEGFILVVTQSIDRYLTALNDKELIKEFISWAASSVTKMIGAENPELVKYGTKYVNYSAYDVNVEKKLIPELFGGLWVANKKLKVTSFEFILERAMFPQLRPIVQELMIKDNAVVPLISNIIDKNCDVNLLTLTLTVLKYTCYDSQALMAEFSEIGGVEAAKRLVEFLSSPEPRVQAGALELIGVFIKDATMAPVWQQADLYSAALAAYKSDLVGNKLSSLELMRCLVYRRALTVAAETDIENKRKFMQVVGLDELKKLLLREADLAVHAVRIIHCLCLPLVPETREMLDKVIEGKVFELFMGIISNPLLLTPQPHPILLSIVTSLKSFVFDAAVQAVVDMDRLVSILAGFSKLPNNVPLSVESSAILKQLGYTGKVCTYPDKQSTPVPQQYAECKTCALTGSEGICIACAEICHKGHEVIISTNVYSFYCRCGNSAFCSAKKLTKEAEPVDLCTTIYTGKIPRIQYAYQCKTCFVQLNKLICATCAKRCHKGHMIVFTQAGTFSCACDERFNSCQAKKKEEKAGGDLRNSAPKEAPQPNEDDALCIICFEKKKNAVFYKCGHLACCFECATQMKSVGQRCPICRQPIADCVKVFNT